MTKSKFPFSAAVGIIFVIVVGLMSHFQCDRAKGTDALKIQSTTVEDISDVIDSLKASNIKLRMTNDSLITELHTVNLELENKQVETVTKVVYRYRNNVTVAPDSNEIIALRNTLDSLGNIHQQTLTELQLTNEQFERVAAEMNAAISTAAGTPCTFFVRNEYLELNATCINGDDKQLSITVPDTLTLTHQVERSWFLGRKTFRVYAEHSNPHVTLDGTVYVIDKKKQRQARRTQRRRNN